MATVITSGTDTITADAVSDYASASTSGNRVHRILGVAAPSAALRTASLRTGTLTLTFRSETESYAAEELHREGGRVFSLASAERPTVNMAYILADGGRIERTLTLTGQWTLTVDFQEVTA